MNTDHELAAWRDEWQAEPQAISTATLRQIVEKESRRMLLRHAAGVLFSLALLAFSADVAYHDATTERIAWAAVVWALTFTAAGFLIWNSRRLWTPDQESSAAFIALQCERCRAALRTVRFGRWFVAIELLIAVPWLSFGRGSSAVTGVAIVLILSAIYLAYFAWYRRHKLKELQSLEELRELLRPE
jgi:hypothetical protein